MMRWTVSLLLFFCLLAGVPAFADLPLLERILNTAKLGAHTAQRDDARFATVQPGKPVGQTFMTSSSAQEVFRIAIWQAFWHETWQPDESLVMTLWDSPQKRVAYARCAIPYSRRMWEGAVAMFTLQAKVEPNRSYYFELTVDLEPLRPAVIPREWSLSGQRPGFAGGDGIIAGIGTASGDYAGGSAYIGGEAQDYDLWFEIHEIHRVERDQLYQRAFGYFNLDYPPLHGVREAVEKRDWEEAVRRLVAHFESREDLIPPDARLPKLNPEFDTREADLASEAKVLLPDGMTVDLGPFWNHYTLWPERGGVGLTRSGLRKILASAYSNTGNEKYARAFSDMLYHLFRQCPSPLQAGVWAGESKIPPAPPAGISGGSMWSALAIGARMGHGFAYYGRFVSSPFFPLDIRAAFIINLGEMAEVIDRMEASGNWETQIADTLLEFGTIYPEFKIASGWIQRGAQRLIENALSTVRPDGVLQEPTTGYHLLVMGRYLNLITQSRDLGISLPPELKALTEKMHEYVMYSTLPDGTLPIWGDGNPPMHPDMLVRAAEVFGREDFRFVGTGGKQGQPPAHTSFGFPHGGFFYMRDSWRRDSHYMGIRCGPHGSHGHWDQLSVIVAPFGRLLLIDPGVYIYGTPEAQELSDTRSHNTVTVDERRTLSGGTPDLWVTASQWDFFAGHNEGYAGLPDVRHHRQIWFLKPQGEFGGLWLMVDQLTGSGEHEAQVWFRFAPVQVQANEAGKTVWTSGEGGNLSIRAVEANGVNLALTEGIAALDGGKLAKVPVARFARKAELPQTFVTLVLPYRGQKPPEVKTIPLSVRPAPAQARAVWVEAGDRAWLLFTGAPASLQGTPPSHEVVLPDGSRVLLKAHGAGIGYAWERNRWQPRTLFGVRVQEVKIGSRSLFRSEDVREKVELSIR